MPITTDQLVVARDAPRVGAKRVDRRSITVVLADDHAVLRRVLRLLLDAEPEMPVVAEATDIDDAEPLTLLHLPRVPVLDLSMPGGSSVEAIPRLRERSPATAIVVPTMHDEPAFPADALG